MTTEVIGDWNEFIANLIVGGANSLQIGEVLIQWGLTGTISGGEHILTFPTAYTSIPSVTLTPYYDTNANVNAGSVHLNGISVNGFTVQNRKIQDGGTYTNVNDGEANPAHWIAIGINNA